MFTSQLLKVTCYKTVVKKGMLQMYVISQIQIQKISSLQNTDVEDGGEILSLGSDYWSTNPGRFWYLCAVMTLMVLGWNERHEITQVFSTLVLHVPIQWNYIQCLKTRSL